MRELGTSVRGVERHKEYIKKIRKGLWEGAGELVKFGTRIWGDIFDYALFLWGLKLKERLSLKRDFPANIYNLAIKFTHKTAVSHSFSIYIVYSFSIPSFR